MNVAPKGDKPKDQIAVKYKVPFGEKTIGVTRNYRNLQSGNEIHKLISIPQVPNISTLNVAVIGNDQYKITQLQKINDSMPRTWLISLSRLEVAYDITTI